MGAHAVPVRTTLGGILRRGVRRLLGAHDQTLLRIIPQLIFDSTEFGAAERTTLSLNRVADLHVHWFLIGCRKVLNVDFKRFNTWRVLHVQIMHLDCLFFDVHGVTLGLKEGMWCLTLCFNHWHHVVAAKRVR